MKSFKNVTIIIFLILSLFITTACDKKYLQEHVKDLEPDSYGLWEVGHISFTAIDSSRSARPLKVDVWYPVDNAVIEKDILSSYQLVGPLSLTADIAIKDRPVSTSGIRKLVVFSHGYGGTNTQSTPLMETLASHGFIVASPEHTGNSQHSPGDSFDQAAMNRVPDVSFVIDTMFSRSKDQDDMFFNIIDESGVGVVGHSFGGMTTIGMAVGWAKGEADPRVRAIAPISAVIDGKLKDEENLSPYGGFDEAKLSAIDIPVMLIGGTKDVDVFIENNELAFKWIEKPDVYRVDIVGANHTHFANVCAIGNYLLKYKIGQPLWGIIGAEELKKPYNSTCSAEAFSIEEAERLQNLYVVAFFNRYLYGLTSYDKYLTKEYAVANEPDIIFSSK